MDGLHYLVLLGMLSNMKWQEKNSMYVGERTVEAPNLELSQNFLCM